MIRLKIVVIGGFKVDFDMFGNVEGVMFIDVFVEFVWCVESDVVLIVDEV